MASKSIAALALLVACVPRYPENPVHVGFEVVIDEASFTQSEVETVAKGIGDWEAATDNLTFRIYEAPCAQFRPAQSICIMSEHDPGPAGNDYVGYWWEGSREIDIDKWRLSRDELRLVTTHEVGHVMGLTHDRTGTAMAYRVDLQTPPTCRDVERFWKQYDVVGWCRL